ncbi:olfactory receptor 1E5-like [Bombina bombina]|uniref:olfactory receptor 1E5-like n=1 Tax=Bombina bombina TaxID=8345 RepID=UPI00235AEEF1|nr:olfactory receptor 1E5-like [Bombina bombina]
MIFIGVLLLYLLAVLGNMIITILACTVSQLHTPMYFFLCNLSVQDIIYVSTILPKLLAITITRDRSIFFSSCITQLFLFALCLVTEFFLLTSMAYDRYVAICNALRYSLIMNRMVCILLATICWIVGTFNSLLFTLMMSKLSFSKEQEVSHFFCDPQTVLKNSCSDTTIIKTLVTMQGLFLGCCPFILILSSYMFIIFTILKIQTSAGRLKAFSSCSSHLMVVFLFYGASLGLNMKPKSEDQQEIEKVLSMLYIAVVPVLNPLVYSLRNRDVFRAMKTCFKHVFPF